MNFTNKTVFISGANRGIGKALVQSLLQRDVRRVYAASRNLDNLPNFADERVVHLPLDITNMDQVLAAARSAQDTDILINNAGAATYTSLYEGNLDGVKHDMNTNLYGTLNMMRSFVDVLETKSNPAIVNIVSIAAFVNFPFLGGYSASKAALFSASQGARLELAAKGIAVHTVNPGPIDTDMTKNVEMEKTSPKDVATTILNALEQNEADIAPDPTGRAMFDMWRNDYRDLEQSVANMIYNS